MELCKQWDRRVSEFRASERVEKSSDQDIEG
jgi:hypothetical protein